MLLEPDHFLCTQIINDGSQDQCPKELAQKLTKIFSSRSIGYEQIDRKNGVTSLGNTNVDRIVELFQKTPQELRHFVVEAMVDNSLLKSVVESRYNIERAALVFSIIAASTNTKHAKDALMIGEKTYSAVTSTGKSIGFISFIHDGLNSLSNAEQSLAAIKTLETLLTMKAENVNQVHRISIAAMVGTIIGALLKTENNVTTIPNHVFPIIPKLLATNTDERMKAITETIKAIRRVGPSEKIAVVNSILKEFGKTQHVADAIGKGYAAILQELFDKIFPLYDELSAAGDVAVWINEEITRANTLMRNLITATDMLAPEGFKSSRLFGSIEPKQMKQEP